MTFNVVSWKGVSMPEVKEPIRVLRLIATRKRKVSSQISFAPNDKLDRAGMNNHGFQTVDVAECQAMLWVSCVFNLFLYLFTRSAIQTAAKTQNIFILVRNSNTDGDMYNGFLFNRRYQTRETNERQSGPSGLVIYTGYQQFHPINVSKSHDKVLPAVKVHRVLQVLAQSMKQTVGSDRSQDSYLCIQRPPWKSEQLQK